MAKIKNKKRKTADTIHNKKEAMNSKKIMNPFEVHVNKEKMKVLGKKQKNDRGLPGISRAKAIEKRKHTLLREYNVQNKANKFMDKRIGEKNKNMTDEDKIMARFAAVRMKAHKKKSIFNLADDEILTHRGQTLSEIEKFDDPGSDDEYSLDDGQTGKLDKDFVEDAHFGGGILRKTGNEGAKTHKELIDQLIAESKKRKAEKQKQKEATLELTEKLDTEWKDLLPLVTKSKNQKDDEGEKPKVDDFDKVMRELRFEARGTVSDRLKTEDEVAKEEKEQLEQLERERLERMKGFVEEKVLKTNHRSADDLDDEFVYDSEPDEEYMLSYNNEGLSNVKVDAEINGKILQQNGDGDDEEDKGDSESVEAEDDTDNGDSDVETDSEDNLSDLKETSDSDSDNEVEVKILSNKGELAEMRMEDKSKHLNNKRKSRDFEKDDQSEKQKKVANDIEDHNSEQIKSELLKIKEIMEKAREELPYTFSLPSSYENLLELFENHSPYHQSVIIERMVKCNHPSLGEGNKESLGLLFAYLMQYLNDTTLEAIDEKTIKHCFQIFTAITPQIYDLAQLNNINAHNSLLEVIKEKHGEYRKRKKQYPGLEVLIFLKLVSILFTTSDFRHQVVTPCFVFMEQMLTKCKVKNRRDISYGLFITALILEYTSLSKRYLPASINFLSGILHMCILKTKQFRKVLLPFKNTSDDLVLSVNYSQKNFDLKMDSTDLLDNTIDEEYKIRVLYTTLKLLGEFSENLKELSSHVEIFEPIIEYLIKLETNINNYPRGVKTELEKLKHNLTRIKSERKLSYVVMESKRPKALRLYEPKIVEVYDGKRHKVQSREKAEREKLLHKLKREKKGALREIRRDKSFLGRVKINQKIQSDKERQEKVKRIYAEASMQQSELNAMDRKKKKK